MVRDWLSLWTYVVVTYRGTSPIGNFRPRRITTGRPQDHHRALGLALLKDPRRVRFLMSEVPLYMGYSRIWTGTALRSYGGHISRSLLSDPSG